MSSDDESLDCVPFVNTEKELKLATARFAGAASLRVTLGSGDDLLRSAKDCKIPLWMDAAVDGFHHILAGSQSFDSYMGRRQRGEAQAISWVERYLTMRAAHVLGHASFIANPDKAAVNKIVADVMSACNKWGPKWISVPQLPMVDDSSRNKLNAALAKAAAAWVKKHFDGELVLPAIFTHRRQAEGKMQWKKKADQIIKSATLSGAKLVWVVDSTLDDALGRPTDRLRFVDLLEFHKHLHAELKNQGIAVIAGPYWGINLALWSRGLAKYPAVALGMSSKFTIPGMPLKQGTIRVVLNCLRRKAEASSDLHTWLKASLKKLDELGSPHKEFTSLLEHWGTYGENRDKARDRAATRYAGWIKALQSLTPNSRGVALFQSFSEAFVTGSALEDLPKAEQPSRRPGQVAEYLMPISIA